VDEEVSVDFAELARGFRVGGRRLERTDQLDDALAEMLDCPEAFVLDVQVACSAGAEQATRSNDRLPAIARDG
jgi:thiamine pyrophosphate-dependent acetolactate synthase large subunit-like protein